MPFVDFHSAEISESIRLALSRYDDHLLRLVASRFIRPRLNQDSQELRDRILESLTDAVSVDRSIKPLSASARRLLRAVGLTRQPRWRVQGLVDFLRGLGDESGVVPILELLDAGLIFPDLPPSRGPALGHFEEWIASASIQPLAVWVVPLAAQRCRGEDLGLPKLPAASVAMPSVLETDGLEWTIRLAVVWQSVVESPIRCTQQGAFFKRDNDRFQAHPLLVADPAEQLVKIPDVAMLAVEWARAESILRPELDQLVAGDLPSEWAEGAGIANTGLLASLARIENWDPVDGYSMEPGGRSFAAELALAMAILSEQPDDAWIPLDAMDAWLADQPEGRQGAGSVIVGGLLFQLRMVQAVRIGQQVAVRLSGLGRAIAKGAKSFEIPPPPIAQTLLVQPNMEIIVYRQGLTPGLISRLTRLAEWRSLGLACTLVLTAESVYRGLEAGETLPGMIAVLERHGTRAVSETVLSSLKSWASKRERVRVFPSAVLIEFRSHEDLDKAVRLGLIEHVVSERIGLVSSESAIDYRHFRLLGTRDYLAPEDLCVSIENGLTLVVNDFKSDLLLESELRRFSELTGDSTGDSRRFVMTPATLQRAREQGIDARFLNDWFRRRTGDLTPPAAKLIIDGEATPRCEVERLTVIRVPSPEVADGLLAWDETRSLIRERISPVVIVVPDDRIENLKAVLARIGVRLD